MPELPGPNATVKAALRDAARALADVGDTARLDAELLMAHALGITRSELLLRHMDRPAPTGFAALLERRLRHEPVAYILGRQEFFGLEFAVGPAVLIPRGDSEVLVERALAAGNRHGRPGARSVLDCGTGSGALLLAVLANLPGASGWGIDASAGALAIARTNAERLGLEARARFACLDWTTAGWSDALPAPFDLILANPPYVEDAATLAPSVRDHEPASALFAGPEGLDAYRVLLPQLPALLAPGGLALVEIGATQDAATRALGTAAGLRVEVLRDLAGRPRVLCLSQEA